MLFTIFFFDWKSFSTFFSGQSVHGYMELHDKAFFVFGAQARILVCSNSEFVTKNRIDACGQFRAPYPSKAVFSRLNFDLDYLA